jgi:arginyl-tRNA synthetase
LTANLYADVRLQVLVALHSVVADVPDELTSKVEVTPTRDPAHGDMATNAAMVVARFARSKPADIAARLVAALSGVPGLVSAEVAGPGFVSCARRYRRFCRHVKRMATAASGRMWR